MSKRCLVPHPLLSPTIVSEVSYKEFQNNETLVLSYSLESPSEIVVTVEELQTPWYFTSLNGPSDVTLFQVIVSSETPKIDPTISSTPFLHDPLNLSKGKDVGTLDVTGESVRTLLLSVRNVSFTIGLPRAKEEIDPQWENPVQTRGLKGCTVCLRSVSVGIIVSHWYTSVLNPSVCRRHS